MKRERYIEEQPAYTRIETFCDIDGCEGLADQCVLCGKDVCRGHGAVIGFKPLNPTLQEFLAIGEDAFHAPFQWTGFHICNECLKSRLSQFEGIGTLAETSWSQCSGGSSNHIGRRKDVGDADQGPE